MAIDKSEKKNKSPAFQFYVKEYETDEKVKMMDVAHEGCYIRLMCSQWMEGSIPADIPSIAKICRVTPRRMQKFWELLQKCFVARGEDRLINERLAEQRAEYDAWCAEQASAGKKGAERRWGKDGDPIRVAMATPSEFDSSATTTTTASATALVIDWAEVEEMDVDNFVSKAIQAANGGMIAAGIQFNPILGSHASRQDVFDWIEVGAARRTILETVFDSARAANKQISSMKYFTKAVTKAREKGRAVLIPEGSQAHEVKQKGISANYPQSQTKRAGNPQDEQDKLDRQRVDEWRATNEGEAEKIWTEIRDEMISKGQDALGKAHFQKAVDAQFRKRVLADFLKPKAVA